MNIFDVLNSILYSKKHITINYDEETNFSYYMVNRWMSMYSKEIASYLNDFSNKYWQLFETKQEQYDYLYNSLPKLKFKKINYLKKQQKKELKENKQLVPEFLSKREYDFLKQLEKEIYE